MVHLKLSSICAGVLGLIYLYLTFNVINIRMSKKITIGHNNDELLELRIRGFVAALIILFQDVYHLHE